MANQRKKGTKLAGAYVPPEVDEALAWLAEKKGHPNKADYLRAIYEKEIAANKAMLASKRAKKKAGGK